MMVLFAHVCWPQIESVPSHHVSTGSCTGRFSISTATTGRSHGKFWVQVVWLIPLLSFPLFLSFFFFLTLNIASAGCFTVSVFLFSLSLSGCERGVSLSGSSGEESTTGFSPWTPLVFFVGEKQQSDRSLRLTLAVPHLHQGFCARLEESGGVRPRTPDGDWFAGHHWSPNRDYINWGSGHDRRQAVSGDRVQAVPSANLPDASAPLCSVVPLNAASRFSDSDQSVIFCILGHVIKNIPFKMADKWLLISMVSMLTLGVYGGKWNDSSGWINTGSGVFSGAAWLG